ncbi:MAG TPA: PHB depolymerase family esterase [Burkholderiaceae bacterium]|nr:PHB depolymerase family esterase [Burkholderiaceae bacterium]
MTLNFQDAMSEATRLTRCGDLQAATALIQATLRNQPVRPSAAPFTSAYGRGDVVDIQARVVDGDTSGPLPDMVFPNPFKSSFESTAASAQQTHECAGAAPGRVHAGEGQPERQPARARRPLFVRPDFEAFEPLVPPLSGRFEPFSMPTPAHARTFRPAPPEGRFINGSHTEAGSTRSYKLYVPAERPGKALPLVVMLHGCTQDPDDFAAGTGMNEAACEQGFYVLYPAQSQKMNPQRCWNWFKHSHQVRGRGEAALLAGMTRAVIEEHGVDPQRVYVAGLSAGGAMAAILGTAYGDVFAAVGVHSGLPVGAAKDLPSALAAMQRGAEAVVPLAPPTIVFHGDQDLIVHAVNGEQAVAACAHTATAAAEVEQGQRAGGHRYTRRIWRNTGGQSVAEHWNVHGAGHAWSGGNCEGSYTDARGPDATEAMLRFFLTHRLNGKSEATIAEEFAS